jgi:hypothetical protein
MTVIIYFTEDKKNCQVIHPQTDNKDSKHNFDGNVGKLVEHLTHSDHSEGIKNYHSFEVI